MALNPIETAELKQFILDRLGSIQGSPGINITLTCDKNELIFSNKESGEEKRGCGEEIAQFEWMENEAVWSIVADLYIMHLSNKHGLSVDMTPLT